MTALLVVAARLTGYTCAELVELRCGEVVDPSARQKEGML